MISHFFLLLSAGLLFVSCKKNYTCECSSVITLYYESDKKFHTDPPYNNHTAPYSEKMKKKQAIAACEHEQRVTQSNLVNAFTANGRDPFRAGESVVTTCKLK